MRYRCLRETLVQSRRYNVNRGFQPGQILDIDCDLAVALPSIARNFKPLPGESPPASVSPEDYEKKLKGMTNTDLFAEAESKGLKPTDSMTKKDMIGLILNPPEDPELVNLGNREPPPEVMVESIETE